LLILGKCETSHEGSGTRLRVRPDGDVQDPDWQGKIKCQNILARKLLQTPFSKEYLAYLVSTAKNVRTFDVRPELSG